MNVCHARAQKTLDLGAKSSADFSLQSLGFGPFGCPVATSHPPGVETETTHVRVRLSDPFSRGGFQGNFE
jgi:hypothetical protein